MGRNWINNFSFHFIMLKYYLDACSFFYNIDMKLVWTLERQMKDLVHTYIDIHGSQARQRFNFNSVCLSPLNKLSFIDGKASGAFSFSLSNPLFSFTLTFSSTFYLYIFFPHLWSILSVYMYIILGDLCPINKGLYLNDWLVSLTNIIKKKEKKIINIRRKKSFV